MVVGNAANLGVLNQANLASARWLLIAIPNGFEAGQIASQARSARPDLEIIARAHFDAEVEYLEQSGANLVIMGEREIAQGMAQRVEETPVRHEPEMPQSA